MVKLCHEKMLILGCIFLKKTEPPPEKNLTSYPLENLEHPDKKFNSLGIILIPGENLIKPLEKYQPSPSKKIPIYKKNIIPCKSFNHPEKLQPSCKSLNPYTGKILNFSKNP